MLSCLNACHCSKVFQNLSKYLFSILFRIAVDSYETSRGLELAPSPCIKKHDVSSWTILPNVQKQIFSFLYSQSLTLSNLIKRSTKFQITWEQKKYLKKNRKFYSSRWPCFSFEKVKTIWYYLLLLLI